MNARNLLFEIGTEEIPARFMPWALEEIKKIADDEFQKERLSYDVMESFGTPRRITLLLRGLAEKQEDLIEEIKGPLWGQAFDDYNNPTRAAIGFAKSRGVPVESLKRQEINGQFYAFAVIRQEGRETLSILPSLLERLVRRLVFPKNMYWMDPGFKFVRPIRWLLCLYGEETVPVKLGNLVGKNLSRGHRFLGSSNVEINSADEYLEKLYDNYVIVDHAKRKEKILSGIRAIERENHVKAMLPPDLVDENVFLVEYPFPFMGTFEERFLSLPEEVLITVMIHHQKYFPLKDDSGKLHPAFIGVSNNMATDMDVVKEGNERVLRARLSDAVFFYNEDLKKPLAARVNELQNIVYHESLGTLLDKVGRVKDIALHLCKELDCGKEVADLVERAAFLSKADLVTNMVYEFPELRGVIGREYAKANGEHERVARALHEQYLPAFVGDALPKDLIGAIVGIADRIDNIVSCGKMDLLPTGSQDPYALRRTARCLNELIIGLEMDVDLGSLVEKAAVILKCEENIGQKVMDFLKQRLYVQLREKGFSHDVATLSLAVIGQRPLQALKLAEKLESVRNEEWFQRLATAAVRVRNILAKASGLDTGKGNIDESYFQSEVEKELYHKISAITPVLRDALKSFDWDRIISSLLELEPIISRFFEEVLVMADDPLIRMNRLSLLAECDALFRLIGDLGTIRE